MNLRRRSLLALLAGAAVLLAPVAASAAKPRTPRTPQVRILGFSTFPRVGVPAIQAKPGKTLTACYDGYNGQREVNVVWQGWGIPRRTKMGIAMWGGGPSSPFQAEPTNEDTMKSGFRWSHKKAEKVRDAYGYSFAGGPFGPQSIDGVWTAKILINGKVVARKKVTIACA